MKIKDLINVSTADLYKVLDHGVESYFNAEQIPELLAAFGEREIYLLSALTSDAFEIILKEV